MFHPFWLTRRVKNTSSPHVTLRPVAWSPVAQLSPAAEQQGFRFGTRGRWLYSQYSGIDGSSLLRKGAALVSGRLPTSSVRRIDRFDSGRNRTGKRAPLQ